MALPEFRNEPFTDFSTDAGRTGMQQALRTVAAQLGKEFPLIIGGQRVTTKDKFSSYNPSQKDEVVAVCQKAAAEQVHTAVAAAEQAFASWSRVSAEERAAILLRAADWLRRRKFEAAAWQVYEVGKNWAEADADVFLEALEAAGLPPGVLNIITASGGTVGDPLVQHPRVRMVAFTGSKDVGLRLYEQTAKVQPGQRWLKRCIAEMGGKNAVLIDEEADLEDAVSAAVVSGYGFQGQKCSAGSRLVATAPIYKEVVEAFGEKVRALEQGAAKDNYFCGPVINENARKKILEYVQIGKAEGRLVAGGEPGDGSGHYVQPTVFVDVPPTARIAQEEIFGPVVAVIKAKDFTDALAIANGTEYGLTGSVFTRNPEKLALARRDFFCGNLYLNRKSTGALVGVHPFGGFNMSGTDAKVGGPDYLLYFLQPRVTAIKYR